MIQRHVDELGRNEGVTLLGDVWGEQDRCVELVGELFERIANAVRPVLDFDAMGIRTARENGRDFQLVGLKAVAVDGEPLGEVVGVEHGPAADLLVLARPSGGRALVPFVKAIVPSVDLAAGRVVLTPPEGLLDL